MVYKPSRNGVNDFLVRATLWNSLPFSWLILPSRYPKQKKLLLVTATSVAMWRHRAVMGRWRINGYKWNGRSKMWQDVSRFVVVFLSPTRQHALLNFFKWQRWYMYLFITVRTCRAETACLAVMLTCPVSSLLFPYSCFVHWDMRWKNSGRGPKTSPNRSTLRDGQWRSATARAQRGQSSLKPDLPP